MTPTNVRGRVSARPTDTSGPGTETPAAASLDRRTAVAINYHFLRPDASGRFRLRAHERPERFAAQIAGLAARFPFCRVSDLVNPDAAVPEATVLITFDDGACDVATEAAPVLRRHAVPATLFVCARPYLEGRLLDIQKIEFLMHELGVARFRSGFYEELGRRFPRDVEREPLDFAGDYAFYRYDDEEIRTFKLDLNYQLPYAAVGPVLDTLFASVFGDNAEAQAVRETYLALDDLKRLVDAGFELGVHTRNHRVLPRLPLAAQREEIETGAEFLREVTGQKRFAVAYPYGFHDEDTHRAMAELDMTAGLSMERRVIVPGDLHGRWNVPRYDVNDCFDRASNEIVDGIFSQLPGAA